MANADQNYVASLSIVWVWVDMTAYTLAWRHPDKLMAVETSATSQAFALCRHPVRPVLLKIAPQPILNPHAHLWDFIQIGVASNPTCSRSHRSDSRVVHWAQVTCRGGWASVTMSNSTNDKRVKKQVNGITDGHSVWSLSAKTWVTTAVR